VLRAAKIYISEPKYDLDGNHRAADVTKIGAGTKEIDWSTAVKLPPTVLKHSHDTPNEPCRFAELPGIALVERNFDEWGDDFVDKIYREGAFDVLKSPSVGMYSRPGESERDFRVRLIEDAREERDRRVDALREKYGSRLERLEDQLERAEEDLDEQKAQASSAKMKARSTSAAAFSVFC